MIPFSALIAAVPFAVLCVLSWAGEQNGRVNHPSLRWISFSLSALVFCLYAIHVL